MYQLIELKFSNQTWDVGHVVQVVTGMLNICMPP